MVDKQKNAAKIWDSRFRGSLHRRMVTAIPNRPHQGSCSHRVLGCSLEARDWLQMCVELSLEMASSQSHALLLKPRNGGVWLSLRSHSQPMGHGPFGGIERPFHSGHVRPLENTDIYTMIHNSSKLQLWSSNKNEGCCVREVENYCSPDCRYVMGCALSSGLP